MKIWHHDIRLNNETWHYDTKEWNHQNMKIIKQWKYGTDNWKYGMKLHNKSNVRQARSWSLEHARSRTRTRNWGYCKRHCQIYLFNLTTGPSGRDISATALACHVGQAYKHLPPHWPTSSVVTWPPTFIHHPEHAFFNMVTHYQGGHA